MKHTRTFLLAGLSILALSLTVGGTVSAEKNVEFVVAEDYYASITDDMTGTTLLNALNALNNQKRKSTVGYAGMRTFARYSDADPNGSGKIISFYDNQLIGPQWDSGDTWNREHVWPNIRGGDKVEMDAHMVRPSATSTNSDRGSKGYGVESYDPGKYVEYYRGSASRIIFYAAMADLSLHLVDDPLNYNGAGQYPDSMGSISEMLAWNLQYQPSNTTYTGANEIARRTEVNRNNVIQNHSDGQGNRNPFIDHPEYACRIWGNFNNNTRAVCSATPIPEDLTSIELNYTEYTLEVGQTVKLEVSPIPSTANLPQLTWGTSNAKVAKVSADGTVSAHSGGKAKINVITSDGKFLATCNITVKGGSGSGCGGNIVTTSVILSTLSILGAGLLIISKFKIKKKEE